MIFPDTERAVMEILDGLGLETTIHLPKDYATDTPLVQVLNLPGNPGPEPFLRTETIQVNVHGRDRDPTRVVANQIRDALTAGPHGTTYGLLDQVTCQVSPHDVILDGDLLNIYSATYLIDVRPIS